MLFDSASPNPNTSQAQISSQMKSSLRPKV